MRLTPFSFASLPILAFALGLAGCGGSSGTTSGTAGSTTTTGSTGGTGGSSTTTTTSSTGGTTTTTTTMAEGPAIPTGVTTYNLKAAAGIIPQPGFMAGYGIASDGAGTYVLAWTGNTGGGNPPIPFEGHIWTSGKFTSVTPGCSDNSCTLEAEDKVSDIELAKGGGQHISFTSMSSDDYDGIEFVVDSEPVVFDLLYDGARKTGRVIYANADKGGSPSNPLEIPFAITTVQ